MVSTYGWLCARISTSSSVKVTESTIDGRLRMSTVYGHSFVQVSCRKEKVQARVYLTAAGVAGLGLARVRR